MRDSPRSFQNDMAGHLTAYRLRALFECQKLRVPTEQEALQLQRHRLEPSYNKPDSINGLQDLASVTTENFEGQQSVASTTRSSRTLPPLTHCRPFTCMPTLGSAR